LGDNQMTRAENNKAYLLAVLAISKSLCWERAANLKQITFSLAVEKLKRDEDLIRECLTHLGIALPPRLADVEVSEYCNELVGKLEEIEHDAL